MLKVLLSVNGRSGRDVKVYQVCKSVGRCSLKNDLPEETAVREKSLSCLLKVAKFWKLYSHRNCFKISLPLGGRSPSLLIASPPPPPPQVCIMFLRVVPTIYLSLFFLSFHSLFSLPLPPPPPLSLCVWLLGLICSLLPPTARSLLQPRCFYTNFSVQLSY